jgi:hypothetical protein
VTDRPYAIVVCPPKGSIPGAAAYGGASVPIRRAYAVHALLLLQRLPRAMEPARLHRAMSARVFEAALGASGRALPAK